MIFGHLEGRQLPFCDRFGRVARNMVIRVHQTELRRNLLVGAKQVQQPDQHKLIVWSRIDPYFN
ncbi:hypothetical protein SE91_09580 [Bradyrhizobium sp. DOA1]|nr:hypothetical protein SE91_09580 [Bradyrhizobium sp. DOA1]